MEYILPPAILFLAFLIKLFIDQAVELPDFVSAVLELPVDIQFLSLSFAAAIAIAKKVESSFGLLLFIAYVIAAIVTTIFWRRSIGLFDKEKLVKCTLLGILNYSISVPLLVYTITLLTNISQ